MFLYLFVFFTTIWVFSIAFFFFFQENGSIYARLALICFTTMVQCCYAILEIHYIFMRLQERYAYNKNKCLMRDFTLKTQVSKHKIKRLYWYSTIFQSLVAWISVKDMNTAMERSCRHPKSLSTFARESDLAHLARATFFLIRTLNFLTKNDSLKINQFR